MIRWLLSPLLLLAFAATSADAHFLFVVPTPDGAKAKVVFSEDLRPDEDVDVAIVAGTKLVIRPAGGADAALAMGNKADHAFVVDLPAAAKGTRVLYGKADLGVMERGKTGPHVLVYHPKAILGDAFDPKATLGPDVVPVEIVPVRPPSPAAGAKPAGAAGELALQVHINGKPVAADVEVVVIRPDGEQEKVKTNAEGTTPAFAAPGRYGAWVRYFDAKPGERDGKKFGETRNYATLVIDVGNTPAAVKAAATQPPGAGHAALAPTTGPAALSPNASHYGRLPERASSFGAAVSDGWLYVYGGHTAITHSYDITAVSGRFHRMQLSGKPDRSVAAPAWEELPGGTGLQGMNLVAHGAKIYRIGGMQPANKPGEKVDNRSFADCARFDPATRKWKPLPALPEPRSSHDVVAIGDKLYVVGGWTLNGKEKTTWPEHALVLDLGSKNPQWKTFAQPFRRRALIAAAHEGKVYVLGGFTDEEVATRQVDIYDPAKDQWTTGPEFPGKDRNGFGPAACTLDGRLYLSVADGSLFRLDVRGVAWEKVAATTPRIVHRLAPDQSQILVLGGATKGDNVDLVEAVNVAAAAAPGGQPQQQTGSFRQPADAVESAAR